MIDPTTYKLLHIYMLDQIQNLFFFLLAVAVKKVERKAREETVKPLLTYHATI